MLPDPGPWLAGLATCPALFFIVVVAATLVLEDVTAVAVGSLVAAMRVDPVLGLAALLFGTVLGDLLLHGAGRLGRGHPWVSRKLAGTPGAARIGRSIWLVAAARVVPGLRVPAYVGSGVAGMPLARFILVVTATGLVWTPLLFLAGGKLAGPGLWGILAVAALLPVLVGKRREWFTAQSPLATGTCSSRCRKSHVHTFGPVGGHR